MDERYIKKKLEFEKKRLKKLMEKHDEYIYNILKTIRNNNNKESITKDEINLILNIIKKEFERELENKIKEEIESEYNKNIFNIFLNKEKYIQNKTIRYKKIITSIENTLKNTYNINNDYSLYYCKYFLNTLITQDSKNNKYTSLKYLLLKVYSLESKYSDITKRLYFISNNLENYNKINEYEQINKDYELKQLKQQMKATKTISQNIKILKYKTDKTCQNGFFGL